MILTTAQKQTLKADILASADITSNPAYSTNPDNGDSNAMIAKAYNTAVPAFIVWKTLVKLGEIAVTWDSAELVNRTTADSTNLQTMAQYAKDGVNPSLAGIRTFYDGIFSAAGGANTRTALAALWKRAALRGEKLFATGTGTSGSPATLVLEGTITDVNVNEARNS